MTGAATSQRAVDSFLEQYRGRELLRFLTCGSVDDGKSTLIGRLLHDSSGVYDDQLLAARRDSKKHGTTGGEIDLALLVDGLQAEREQRITIDVAYRYFSTPRRKFIIADTPGHEQYTRNMATGASTCDLAVILVDATRGVLDQTRRHAFIAALLGIRHLIVAVNKMDLVGYGEETYERIRGDFTVFAAKLQVGDVQFIPMSALRGDNVVHPSDRMPWYQGGPLLDYLERVHIASDRNLIDFRFPVQLVVRPNASFRGYAGSIASGAIRRGDEVTALPSGVRSRVRAIHTAAGPRDLAVAPMPITVELEDEVDISRGDMLVHPNNAPRVEQGFEAMVVWMSDAPALQGRAYLLKHTTVLTPATLSDLRYRMNVNTLHRESCEELRLNEIGRMRIETGRFLTFDSYQRNRATGCFILIDRVTNATVGAGMILDRDPAELVIPRMSRSTAGRESGPAAGDWEERIGHRRFEIEISGAGAMAHAAAIRDELFRRGYFSYVTEAQATERTAADLLGGVGVSVIIARETSGTAELAARGPGDAEIHFTIAKDVSPGEVCDRLEAERILLRVAAASHPQRDDEGNGDGHDQEVER